MIRSIEIDTRKARIGTLSRDFVSTENGEPRMSVMLTDGDDFAHLTVSRDSALALADAFARAAALIDRATVPLVSVGPGGMGHPDSKEIR